MPVAFLFKQADFLRQGANAEPVLTADITTEEQHEMKVVYTDFPVENGGRISDHARRENYRFTLSVLVTGTPLTGQPKNGVYLTTPEEVQQAGSVLTVAQQVSRVQETFAKFKTIIETNDREFYTVVHSLGFYENMVLESVAIPRTPDAVTYGVFSCTFREITVAELQKTKAPRVAVVPPADKKTDARAGASSQAQTTLNAGNQSTQNKSLAAQWRDGDIGLLEYLTGGLKAGIPGA